MREQASTREKVKTKEKNQQYDDFQSQSGSHYSIDRSGCTYATAYEVRIRRARQNVAREVRGCEAQTTSETS